MSRNVKIEIFTLAQTRVNPEEVVKWLKFLEVTDQYIEDLCDSIERDEITDPALLIAMAAKRCYKSFEAGLNPNVTKVRSDWTEYIDNILKSGHGSVCEHSVFTFAIENVSRVFTGEMNRHRAGVGISEGSMRYIRYRDIPWWCPTSITLTPEEETVTKQTNPLTDNQKLQMRLAQKKLTSQEIFKEVFEFVEHQYARLQQVWHEELAPESKFHGKKEITSMVRRIIPMGVATGGVWTLNIRALRHVLALRASSAAEEEIVHVMSRIGKMMVEAEPMLLGDFTQTAEGFWTPKYPKV